MIDSQPIETRFLPRPGGRIAYDVTGSGPLVICVPGMGEVRSTFRFLAPALVEAGFRVARMDLRGHGDSDATFDNYDDVALESDIRTLIDELGGPAVLVGSSMGAAAGVLVAVDHPDVIRALVFTGPFVRDVPQSRSQELVMRAAMAGPWARAAWMAYYSKFYPGDPGPGFEEHRTSIGESMRGKGKRRAFSRTTRSSHAQTDAVLDTVRTPTLVVMGSADPDFADPTAEAHMIARRTEGSAHIVDGAGHYPHAQRPDEVNPVVVEFLRSLPADA
jgi:pimeloyl-ACP methyl ester carboxylesterase